MTILNNVNWVKYDPSEWGLPSLPDKNSIPLPSFVRFQNDYPTVTPSEFQDFAGERVDTLINNMRVNLYSNPTIKSQYLRECHKANDYSLSVSDTIVIAGKKPVVQTIKRPVNGQVAIIDWINFTFDIATIGENFRRTNEDDEQYMALCQSAVAEFAVTLGRLFGKKYSTITQRQTGANFYKYSFVFGDNYGKICIGGQRDTVLVMLTGTGCSLAPKGFERKLHSFLSQAVKSKITRVDLAHDDIKGDYLDINVLDKLEDDGLFSCGGAPHAVQNLGEWKHGDPNNKGLTLQLGKRSSGKMTRFYEKGKQLGDKDGDYSRWVRAEVEFKATDRIIPFDVLIDPSSYFMGAYPVFADLFDYERINKLEIIQKTSEITLQHSFDWINRQAGKYFSFYRSFMSDSEIIDLLVSDDPDDVPDRLHLPHEYAKGDDLGSFRDDELQDIFDKTKILPYAGVPKDDLFTKLLELN